jgi:hypothetical protein
MNPLLLPTLEAFKNFRGLKAILIGGTAILLLLLGLAIWAAVAAFSRLSNQVPVATTCALGQVAKRYYASGRKMSTALLQDSFRDLLDPAKKLQAEYLPQIKKRQAP